MATLYVAIYWVGHDWLSVLSLQCLKANYIVSSDFCVEYSIDDTETERTVQSEPIDFSCQGGYN